MGLHDGHRDRMRERFTKEGANCFAAHNLLELLLFYAIPRRDTNETAHKLLSYFGDVQSVLSAPVEELCKVDGISKNSAVLIRLCGELGTRYIRGETASLLKFNTFDDIGNYLVKLYQGITDELIYMLMLNNNGTLIKVQLLAKGSFDAVTLRVRDVVAAAISANAGCVVLAHNHPAGNTEPSTQDTMATTALSRALSVSGITMAEHFIIAGNSYSTMVNSANRIFEIT